MDEKLIEIAERIYENELASRGSNPTSTHYLTIASEVESLIKNLSIDELLLIDCYIEEKFLTK